MTASFVHEVLASRVVFGVGAVERLAQEIDRLGVRRVLVVAGGSGQALVEQLRVALGDLVVGVHGGVRAHVPVAVAQDARRVARDLAADGVLTVGGGSATGLGKAVALELPVPIVAIPTTYAGSEVTPIWGLTTEARKQTGRDPRVLPAVVLYDPALTVGLPPAITGTSGMNAMAHCVEALYAPGGNPITSLMAEEGIRALARGLPAAVERGDDLDARTDCLYGAWLAGSALGIAGAGIHHTICHVLGGAYDLPHAAMHTVVLPHAVAFVAPAAPQAMARIARALGGDAAAPALHDLNARIGAPRGLGDIGMREADLPEAARLVVEADPPSPRPVDLAGMQQLLTDAHRGAPSRSSG